MNDARTWSEADLEQIRGRTGLEPLTGPEVLGAAAGDFGRLVQGACPAVVRPTSAAQVEAVVALASERGLGLTVRAGGTSQSGQSVARDTVCLDLTSLREVELPPGGETVHCGAGITFRELRDRCAAAGRLPAVMPLNLDLTVGGVLSAGGFGSTSHREGLLVSLVRSLEVVLGSGRRVLATPAGERTIFDAVLGGVGRFGAITRAELPLRPLRRQVRTHYLLYDDLQAFLDDQIRLREEGRCDHLEGFCSASVQGVRLAEGGGWRPFARWFYGLHVGCARDDGPPPDPAATLAGLHHRELVHVEDAGGLEHAARYDLRFGAMKATGAWEQAHPWTEWLVPATAARTLLPGVLETLPLFLGDGHRLSLLGMEGLPALFMRPRGEPVFAFAVLPMGVPAPFLPRALEALRRVNDLLLDHGAKRYLSGWLFDPDETTWRRHFGDHHDHWRQAKRTLDPTNTLRSALFPISDRVAMVVNPAASKSFALSRLRERVGVRSGGAPRGRPASPADRTSPPPLPQTGEGERFAHGRGSGRGCTA